MSGTPCHRCPYGIADADGLLLPEYAGLSYQRLPCSDCTLAHGHSVLTDADRIRMGVSTVSLDAMGDISVPQYVCDTATIDDCSQMLMEFMNEFLKLDRITMKIVVNWLSGNTQASLSDALLITPQAINARLKRAIQRIPALSEVKAVYGLKRVT